MDSEDRNDIINHAMNNFSPEVQGRAAGLSPNLIDYKKWSTSGAQAQYFKSTNVSPKMINKD